MSERWVGGVGVGGQSCWVYWYQRMLVVFIKIIHIVMGVWSCRKNTVPVLKCSGDDLEEPSELGNRKETFLWSIGFLP